MNQDHYQILGVQPGDDRAAILTVFRKLAMIHHPDRGGSLETMKRINEAWFVLSDPDRRRNHDELRLNPNNPDVVQAAYQDAQYAKQRAEDFPQKWEDFDDWLKSIANDFTNAKYESAKFGNTGINIPIVTDSASGCLFVLIGAVLGGVIGFGVYGWLSEYVFRGGHPPIKPVPLIAAFLCLVGGAWVGTGLHQAIASSFKTKGSAGQARNETGIQVTDSESTIVACDMCRQKLRIPKVSSELLVTCTKCRNQFTSQPS